MQVPARREFRHGEDAGPLQPGFRPNENAALTLFREALSSSAPAGKTLPIAPPRFQRHCPGLWMIPPSTKNAFQQTASVYSSEKDAQPILLQPIIRHIRRTQTFQKAGEAFCTGFLRIPLPEQDAQFRQPLNDRSDSRSNGHSAAQTAVRAFPQTVSPDVCPNRFPKQRRGLFRGRR